MPDERQRHATSVGDDDHARHGSRGQTVVMKRTSHVPSSSCCSPRSPSHCQPIPKTKGSIELDLQGVNPRVCDVIDLRQCLLPFPNDFFTVRDANTDTGRRVAITAAAMPRNNMGVPIDPTEWNRNDGFSPGSEILTSFPAST